jgi:hypothetical protein
MTLRYIRHPDVRLTALEGEGVALQLDSRRYFTLNETGLVLVEALAQPRTMDDLVADLVAKFEVGADEAADVARPFVDRCVAAGLVVMADAT